MSATATTTHTHTSSLGENTRVGYERRTGQPYLFERRPSKRYGHKLKPLAQRRTAAEIERRRLKREDRATFRSTVGKHLAILTFVSQATRGVLERGFFGRLKWLLIGR